MQFFCAAKKNKNKKEISLTTLPSSKYFLTPEHCWLQPFPLCSYRWRNVSGFLSILQDFSFGPAPFEPFRLHSAIHSFWFSEIFTHTMGSESAPFICSIKSSHPHWRLFHKTLPTLFPAPSWTCPTPRCRGCAPVPASTIWCILALPNPAACLLREGTPADGDPKCVRIPSTIFSCSPRHEVSLGELTPKPNLFLGQWC